MQQASFRKTRDEKTVGHSSRSPGRIQVQQLGQDFHYNELLTLRQVADLLKVCIKTVRRLIRRCNIPHLRVGNQIRI